MVQDIQKIEEKIFDYVRKNTHADTNSINSKTFLFKDGVFDSMGFVLLIDFLEQDFGIRTSDSDLVEENFESITAITNYILKKQTVHAA